MAVFVCRRHCLSNHGSSGCRSSILLPGCTCCFEKGGASTAGCHHPHRAHRFGCAALLQLSAAVRADCSEQDGVRLSRRNRHFVDLALVRSTKDALFGVDALHTSNADLNNAWGLDYFRCLITLHPTLLHPYTTHPPIAAFFFAAQPILPPLNADVYNSDDTMYVIRPHSPPSLRHSCWKQSLTCGTTPTGSRPTPTHVHRLVAACVATLVLAPTVGTPRLMFQSQSHFFFRNKNANPPAFADGVYRRP